MIRVLLAACLWASIPGPALAGPLTGGTLAYALDVADPEIFVADATAADTATSAAAVTLAAGSAFADARTLFLNAPPLSGAFLTIGANSAGQFEGIPLAGTGAPFDHRLRLQGLGMTLFDFDFAIGAPRTAHATGSITWQAEGFSWTSGALAVTGVGSGATTQQRTGSVVTGAPGLVSLVAATRISTSLSDPFPQFFDLTLDFEEVAEPGAAGLLACGALCLAAAGWRRAQRSRPR